MKTFSRYNKGIKDKEVIIMIKFNIRGETSKSQTASTAAKKDQQTWKYFTENQSWLPTLILKFAENVK